MRVPCKNCPWRKSTRTEDIPGGGLDHEKCRNAAQNRMSSIAMMCHRTDRDEVCAGFVLQVSEHHLGLRMAVAMRMVPGGWPEEGREGFSAEGVDLHEGWEQLLAAHPPGPEDA